MALRISAARAGFTRSFTQRLITSMLHSTLAAGTIVRAGPSCTLVEYSLPFFTFFQSRARVWLHPSAFHRSIVNGSKSTCVSLFSLTSEVTLGMQCEGYARQFLELSILYYRVSSENEQFQLLRVKSASLLFIGWCINHWTDDEKLLFK